MNFDLSSKFFRAINWLEECTSTNSYVRENWSAAEGHRVVTLTDQQTAGKGRQGRGWSSPKGESLAISVVLEPAVAKRFGAGWVPLMVGSAAVQTLQHYLPTGYEAKTKWPNDVHVLASEDSGFGLKLVGILCEMLPDFSIIAGAGFNLFTPQERLPTERASSLLALGAELNGLTNSREAGGEEFVDKFLARFGERIDALSRLGAEELQRVVAQDSHTIGRLVRAELPGGADVVGHATGLADDGSLLIRTAEAELIKVSAGDVWHLRDASTSAGA